MPFELGGNQELDKWNNKIDEVIQEPDEMVKRRERCGLEKSIQNGDKVVFETIS